MKKLIPIFLAALLCGVFGCAAVDSDRARFARIAESLDPEGSVYFISSSRHAGTALEKQIRKHETLLWDTQFPSTVQFRLQHFISCSELFGRLAGLHEIKGWGGSSRQFLSAQEVLFRNKFRLLLPQKRQGILWQIFSAPARPLEKYLCDLPEDTYFAGAAELSLVPLQKITDTDKNISPPLKNICKIFLAMTPEELLRSLSGVWKIIIVCDEANDPQTLAGIHIALTVPDRGGKIFKALCQKLKYLPNSNINEAAGTIRLAKMPGKMCIPYLRRGKDSLVLYTSPLAAVRTNRSGPVPQLSAAMQHLAQFSDLEGIGVFYSRNALPGTSFSNALDMSSQSPVLTVLKGLPDGFIAENISNCDFNSYAVNFITPFPVKLVFDLLTGSEARKAQKKAAPRSAPGVTRKNAPAPGSAVKKPLPRRSSCLAAIRNAGKRLSAAAAASGKWQKPGITGLRELVKKKVLTEAMLRCPETGAFKKPVTGLNYANCHYLYFGKPGKNSPRTPLLMEFPFLHKGHFSVFYADGKAEKIRLDGRRNVRRAVSFLHTVHSYDESEFIRLMQLASEFDKILER